MTGLNEPYLTSTAAEGTVLTNRGEGKSRDSMQFRRPVQIQISSCTLPTAYPANPQSHSLHSGPSGDLYPDARSTPCVIASHFVKFVVTDAWRWEQRYS